MSVLEVLERAEGLVAAHRWADAIDLLTEENRRARSPHVEERLVQLRHDAFLALAPERVDVEPDLHASGPGGAELPEYAAADLTVARVRDELAAHGCILVRGLIPADRAAALRDDIDTALSAFDAGLDGAERAETSPWYAPFRPSRSDYRIGGRKWMRQSGGLWAVDSPHMLFDVVELLTDTGVVELVTEYFGERPALSANKCNLRRVPVDTATNWHQDGAFLGRAVQSLNLWLALGDCGVTAPGLDLVPRRLDDLVATGTEGAIFDWSVAPDVVEEAAGSVPVIRPEFGPGDALLFDHLFLHRTGVSDGMIDERHALECWFFAPSSFPTGQIPVLL